MKSTLFSAILLFVGITATTSQVHADPTFTTRDPIGRVLGTKSGAQYLSYYCLARTEGANGEFKGNPKCIASQYAVSTKSGTLNVDGLGNQTRDDGEWSPVGPIFNESSVKAFQNRMRAQHAEAYDEIWGGIFQFQTGWQNEAKEVSQEAMKEFIDCLIDIQDRPSENWATDAAQYASAGRVIENKLTGETLDIACLEIPVKGVPCRHFQVRYTQNGASQLVGSELIVKVRKDQIKETVVAKSNEPFDAKKPYYNSGMPFMRAALDNEDYGLAPYIGLPAGIDVLVMWPVTAAIGLAALPAVGVLTATLLILPAVDLTIGAGRNLTKAARRFIISSREHHAANKLTRIIDEIFDGAKLGEKSIRVKNTQFQLLKDVLTAQI